ncbi:GH25 family lysozyme [Enterococcus dongliensis]|uniref:GH25 family lysozyme n=1 Tax=Enterococcus dongliensis TaxID=2559925 RepID=UPI0028906ED0|nr:GH25 family lysozyme [Enterococcus dongliensis]MDT2614521.1 GH25 family lysozyme [Enterococcus dongliensis]
MVLNGVDVASWQVGIDFSKIACDFAIIKATGGKSYVNPHCDTQYQSAKKSGKLLGVYHYAHESGMEGTAAQEAQFFLDNVKGYIGEAILILDWESSNKGDVAWAKAWLDYVYAKTGIRPLFYTYTGVLNSYNFSSIANANYGLWIANYGTDAAINGFKQPSGPVSPYWTSTAMYQYSSNTFLSGWSGRLDANVFYGDKNTWKAYASKEGTITGSSTTNSSTQKPTQTKKTKEGNVMLLFKENGKVYWLVGNQFTHVAKPAELNEIKIMMKQAGYDTHEHTNSSQIAYIKKIATEKK